MGNPTPVVHNCTFGREVQERADGLKRSSRYAFLSAGSRSTPGYAREWIDSYAGRTSKGIRPATIEDYRRNLEHDAIPYFAAKRLVSIGPRDVKQFARLLRNER